MKKTANKTNLFTILLTFALSFTAMPVVAVTVTQQQDLSFGKLIAGSGGTAVINPNGGARSVTGGVIAYGNSGFQPARFTITYAPLELLLLSSTTITVTPDPATLSRSGGGSMSLSSYAAYPFGFGTTLLGRILGLLIGESVQYYVGGTLTVDPNETPGLYDTTITLTVTVN